MRLARSVGMSKRALVGVVATVTFVVSATEALAQRPSAPDQPVVAQPPADDSAVPTLRLSAAVREAVAGLDQIPRIERPKPAPRQPSSVTLNSLYVATAVVQALDVHSTLLGIRSGAVEANPMMETMVKRPGVFIATKAALSVGTIMAARSVAKKNKVTAVIALAAVNAVYGAVVYRNYQIARTMR